MYPSEYLATHMVLKIPPEVTPEQKHTARCALPFSRKEGGMRQREIEGREKEN